MDCAVTLQKTRRQQCCCHGSNRNKFVRLKRPLLFLTLLLLTLLYVMFDPNISRKIEPWEKSLPGNLDTCASFAAILLEKDVDEGSIASEIFSWKTPRFVDLILSREKQNKENAAEELIDILCKPFMDETVDLFSLAESKLQQPFLTSSHHSSFKVINENDLIVGNEIKLLIETKDASGKSRSFGGGDFFKIRAENPETRSAVAATDIVDNGNGSFTASIKTFWAGRNNIKVFFGQSGHFVDLIKRLTSKYRAIEVDFRGEYVRGCDKKRKHCPLASSRELKSCAIDRNLFHPGNRVCNYSRNKGEEWFCEHPSLPLTCNDLHAVYSKRNQNSLALFKHFPVHDRGTLKRKTLNGYPQSVDMGLPKEKPSAEIVLQLCGPNLKTPHPAGYWEDGLWRSRVCRNIHYSLYPERKKRCLRNRVFYFVGDSTARQWFEFFIEPPDEELKQKLGLIRHPFKAREVTTYSDVWEPRTAIIDSLNATFHYRCHGQPVQNGGLSYAPQFISALFDQIPHFDDEGSQLTIVMAIGPHFFLYNPDVYMKRILASRDAALRLLSRNPKATVIFKGTNTFIRGIGIGECCYSDWLSFRQQKLARHVFDGTSIIYLDVWDMTVSHDSEDLIHPVSDVITNEIDMALSFTCPEL